MSDMRSQRGNAGPVGTCGVPAPPPKRRRPIWRGARGDRPGSRTLLRDQRGVAAVEFGLIAVIMFVMMAGAVDLSQRIIFQRDLKRFTTSVALAMAACPSGGGDCMTKAVNALKDRIPLLLPGVETRELRLASFFRQNNKIVAEAGLTTYLLPAEEPAAAALATNEGDRGVLVSIKATHDPIFPSFAANWGLVSKEFSESTMQLSYRNL